MKKSESLRGNCLYPWFQEHGEGLIAEADFAAFAKLSPYGKVFVFENLNDGTFQLRYGSQTFRVKPDLIQVVPAVRYKVGDMVMCIGLEQQAKIVDVTWHHDRNAPFYTVSCGGKRRSKRYWDSDLTPICP